MVAIVMIASVGFAMAQKGEMAGGIQLNYGTQGGVGVGAKFQYGITNAIRIEPSVNYYLGGSTSEGIIDATVNAHYLFGVAPKINVYPLIGLGFASCKSKTTSIDYNDSGAESQDETVREGLFAVNIGAGGEYQLTEKWVLDVEMKYQIISGFGQFVIGAGIAYKF